MEECSKCKSKEIKTDKFFKYHDVYRCIDCEYWTYERHEECCREPFKIIVIDRKNHDLYFIREQCFNCGGCRNKQKPLSSKIYGDQIREELNTIRESEYWDDYQDEKSILASLKKEYRFYNSPSYKYYMYLSSPEWKAKRKLVFERDNNVCRVCEKSNASEVHHLTYENVFNEALEDLISICHECHKGIHQPPSFNNLK